MFIIEDEIHAEWLGEYENIQDAFEELKRIANLPWDEAPNKCPCMAWKTCGRNFQIVEFDASSKPWNEINRTGSLEISSKGTNWLSELSNSTFISG